LAATQAFAQAPVAPIRGTAVGGFRSVGQPLPQTGGVLSDPSAPTIGSFSGNHDFQGSIEGPCPECGIEEPCESCSDTPFWAHRHGIFAEWIYLRAGNVDIDYALPVDGTASSAVPTGPLGMGDPEHESGFRIGFDICLDEDSSIRTTYHFYESSVADEITPPPGDVIRALTTHPNTLNAFADSNAASSVYDIDFDIVDIDYRHLLIGGCNYGINYSVGARYAKLKQDFDANYIINGATNVNTDIDFDGIGPRIGLDAERLIGRGFLVYTRSAANFLVGDFSANYRQTNIFAGTQANTRFEDDRVVPILEFEAGVGWQSCSGCFSVRAGYYVAGWFNTLTTPTFIDAVQANDYSEADETLTFDGVTVRAEWRF
jgi:hypothetical protein